MKKIINPWRNHPEYRSTMPLRSSKNCFGYCPEKAKEMVSFHYDVEDEHYDYLARITKKEQ